MSYENSIEVSGLSKSYAIYPSLKARIFDWIFPSSRLRRPLKKVLQDITFSIKRGESVGIIGVNGAGKSTLLKLITGTARPTAGSIKINGTVSALLELGMGFHPDFTGRQNAITAGQLLGLSTAQILDLMPSIESFAEIGDYIDRPTRIYSSGMQMRLAFSVATSIRPDILIVDEALSVGDSYFQHKSFERIKEFNRQGTSLLIVSHDRWAIQNICDRAILLSDGRIVSEGVPEVVTDYYNALIANGGKLTVKQSVHESGAVQTISGDGEAQIDGVFLTDLSGNSLEVIKTGQPVILKVIVNVIEDIPELVMGYMIKDRLAQPIFGTNTFHADKKLHNLKKGQQFQFECSFIAALGEGNYSIAIALHTTDAHIIKNYEWRDLALVFTVINDSNLKFIGTSWMPPKININSN
jgi:lipopolysaccharide transport system ATP-binding protein